MGEIIVIIARQYHEFDEPIRDKRIGANILELNDRRVRGKIEIDAVIYSQVAVQQKTAATNRCMQSKTYT